MSPRYPNLSDKSERSRLPRGDTTCFMDLEVTTSLTIPATELVWRFSRSSGPGGQHVNTSDSRVQVTWSVIDSNVVDDKARALLIEKLRLSSGAITVTVSEQRSQLRNREIALDNLALAIRGALAPPSPPRRPTKPTRGSARRHLAAKKQRAQIKQRRQRPNDFE